MIQTATPEMIPALKLIWNACFGDDSSYIDFLFERFLRPERILVQLEEGVPASMLCTEPFVLQAAADRAFGAYIYAVATLPQRQGKGLSTKLLHSAHQWLCDAGVELSALVPASESLFQFYRARGYQTAFHIVKADYFPGQLPPPPASTVVLPVRLDQCIAQREAYYSDRPLIRWSEAFLSYITDECRMLGGEVLTIASASFKGYAVCYRVGDVVYVKEITVPPPYLETALAALHTRLQACRYHVYLPADTPEMQKKDLPFAMVRWYDKQKRDLLHPKLDKSSWIAHVLD